jgi:hypothetical protein
MENSFWKTSLFGLFYNGIKRREENEGRNNQIVLVLICLMQVKWLVKKQSKANQQESRDY